MVKYTEREIATNGGKALFEAKELCAKYTTENIAVCGFGAEGRCFDDPNAEFRKIGRKIFEISLFSGIVRLIILLFPFISNIFNVT